MVITSNDLAEKRRINEFLKTYWEGLRRGRPYPYETEIDIRQLELIWDSCFLVRKEDGDEKPYNYLYLGTALINAYGDDLNEREVCERLIFPSSMSLVHRFDEVMHEGKPVLDESEFTNNSGMLIRYRSIMLPLAKENGTVGFIIGGMRWKAFR